MPTDQENVIELNQIYTGSNSSSFNKNKGFDEPDLHNIQLNNDNDSEDDSDKTDNQDSLFSTEDNSDSQSQNDNNNSNLLNNNDNYVELATLTNSKKNSQGDENNSDNLSDLNKESIDNDLTAKIKIHIDNYINLERNLTALQENISQLDVQIAHDKINQDTIYASFIEVIQTLSIIAEKGGLSEQDQQQLQILSDKIEKNNLNIAKLEDLEKLSKTLLAIEINQEFITAENNIKITDYKKALQQFINAAAEFKKAEDIENNAKTGVEYLNSINEELKHKYNVLKVESEVITANTSEDNNSNIQLSKDLDLRITALLLDNENQLNNIVPTSQFQYEINNNASIGSKKFNSLMKDYQINRNNGIHKMLYKNSFFPQSSQYGHPALGDLAKIMSKYGKITALEIMAILKNYPDLNKQVQKHLYSSNDKREYESGTVRVFVEALKQVSTKVYLNQENTDNMNYSNSFYALL